MAIQGGLQGSLEGRCIRIRGGRNLGHTLPVQFEPEGFWLLAGNANVGDGFERR